MQRGHDVLVGWWRGDTAVEILFLSHVVKEHEH